MEMVETLGICSTESNNLEFDNLMMKGSVFGAIVRTVVLLCKGWDCLQILPLKAQLWWDHN